MRKLFWLMLMVVGLSGGAFGQTYQKIQGFCENGGSTVTTDGRTSTTKVQRSYPSCTVQVFDGGTLVNASIASNDSGTPKSNPFTADTDGYWFFYALAGTYDVKMSGGGLASPITRSGYWIVDGGGGGSGITGSGTTDRFPIFTGTSSIGNSVFKQVGTSEFTPTATGKRINLGTGSQQTVEIANASVGGTTQNRIAKLSGAPSTALTATVTDTTKLVGIVIAGAGTTGNAQIVTNGNVACDFDGATTAGNYVGASTTSAGKCTDLGSTLPTTGVQVLGRVLTTLASAGSATVYVFTGEQGRGGTAGSGTTNYLPYWVDANTLGATNALYSIGSQLFQFGYSVDIANGGLSELTLETDQIIFKGGVSRANNSVMQTMKATASQTGPFQRFTTSTGAVRFDVDIDGDVKPRGVNYTWPSSLPGSTGVLQITTAGVMSVVSGVASNVVQAYNVYVDGGCAKDGLTDVTTCMATALAAANSSGRPLYFPAGTYLGNLVINGLNSLKIFGDGPGRSIIQSATGASAVMYADNSLGLTHSLTIEDLSLQGFGSGAADYGFYMTPDQPFDLTLRNVRVTNTAGNGVYIPTNAFTMLFDGVDVSSTGGNGFDIFGDNTVTFIRTYVHSVGSSGTAYRLRSGRFTLIGANGIDSGISASWGIFGDLTAEDGADAYARVSLKGCNVEAWTSTSYAVRVKTGSQLSVENTHFITGASITTSAILFDNADPNLDGSYVGRLDGLSAFTLGSGSAWTNSYPIRSRGIPFLMDGERTASYYDTNLAAAVLMPFQSVALNGASFRGATKFNRLALGTAANEGFDGNLNFISDNARDIGTPSAGRPANIYVGTKVQMANGTTTVQGQNWTVTGGASPSLAYDDASIAGRFQLLTGSYLQLGTTSVHDLVFLSSNTPRWRIDSSGNFWVDSGSLTIGKAAGNRPTIGYFSTSVNPGTPGVTTGSLVFGNASNSNTTTIQSGVAAASRTYTWPTNFGAAGAVLTDAAGNGTLSWAVPGGASLTSTFVGYGNGSNVLTGTSDYTYSTSTKTLSVINGSGASTLVLNGSSDTSSVKFGAASMPGNQGGIFFPFVGGANSSGPGIWWGSSASYSSLSGIYLNNGFTFQGANSTHDQVKIAEATGTSSNGTVRFTWQPSSSLYIQTGSLSSTGTAGEVVRWDVSSTGTAAANFGAYSSHRLENGSGSQVEAVRLTSSWQTATAAAETGRFSVATNLAGAGVGDAFTVEGGQYYGTLWDKGNISGSVTLDFINGNSVTATLTGNVTSLAFSNLRTGGVYFIHFIQNALGPWTLTVPAALKVNGGYTITATINKRDLLICNATSTTQLYCSKAQDQQ